MVHLLASALLFLSNTAFAKPACTVAGVTDNCKAFEKYSKQPTIKLPDGTSFPNPLATMAAQDPELEAIGHEGHNHGAASEPNGGMALELEDQRLQMKIMDVLSRLSAEKTLNSNFKTDFLSLTPPPDQILKWAGKTIVYPPGIRQPEIKNVTITWPPDDLQAGRKEVPVTDIVKWLNQLPAPYKQQMRAFMNSRGTLKNAFFSSPDAMAGAPAQSPLSPEVQKRMVQLFEFTRKNLIAEVTRGRDAAALSDAEQIMVNRIKTATFDIADSRNPMCAKVVQTAFYNPLAHQFQICSPYSSSPKTLIVRTMAHEMAHAFDPCTQTLPFVKVNKDKLAKLGSSPGSWPEPLRKDRELGSYVTGLMNAPNVQYQVFQAKTLTRNQNALQELVKLGILSVVDNGFTNADDPARDAYQCLRDSGPFNEMNDSALETIATKTLEKLSAESAVPIDKTKFVSDLKARMKPHAQCVQGVPGLPAHMNEVMADAWGAKVMGRWLEKNRPKNTLEKVGMIAMDAGFACNAQITGAAEASNTPSINEAVTIINLQGALHPPAPKRVNKILFTDAKVQSALGCEPDPNLNCLAKMGSAGAPVSQPKPVRSEGTVQ